MHDHPSDRPTAIPDETQGASPEVSAITRRLPAIPAPSAVPRLVLAVDELGWVAIAGNSKQLAQRVDGKRTVRELAEACGFELETAQLIVADLRDRHVLAI